MMQINIKLMSEEAYKTLQKNLDYYYKILIEHPLDSSWLKNSLGFEPFETKKYTINDFVLKVDGDYSKVAFENAVTLYEALKELPRYIVCNPRFWAWIIFEKAYKVALLATKLKSSKTFSNMWVPGNSKVNDELLFSKKSLILGVISRYFFAVEMSVDGDNENKYFYTEYLIPRIETFRTIAYRSIGMIKNVSLSILKVLRDFSIDNNTNMSLFHERELMKEASRMGSVMLIDTISKEFIYSYLYSKLIEIHKELIQI